MLFRDLVFLLLYFSETGRTVGSNVALSGPVVLMVLLRGAEMSCLPAPSALGEDRTRGQAPIRKHCQTSQVLQRLSMLQGKMASLHHGVIPALLTQVSDVLLCLF